MLRNLFSRAEPAAGGPDHLVLLHSALDRAEVIFGDELRGYAAEGRLRLVELQPSTACSTWPISRRSCPTSPSTTYACGPAGLLDAIEAHHARRCLPLHVEQFRPRSWQARRRTFASGVSVEADGSSPILDVAEDAGVPMPSGCRMGICFGCVLPMTEGAVRDAQRRAHHRRAHARSTDGAPSRPIAPPLPARSTTDGRHP